MPQFPNQLSFNGLDRSPSGGPSTPSVYYFRASKSFENLVSLANDQERWKAASKAAKKAVWRDKGEPPVPLDSFTMCLDHATRGALRAGILAGAIRAGVNIFLLLFRVLRAPKKFRFKMILHALFGKDTLRFSAMLASFAFIWKFILNSLPLVPIPDQLAILRSSRQARQRRRELDLEKGGLDTHDGSADTGYSTRGDQSPGLMMKSSSGLNRPHSKDLQQQHKSKGKGKENEKLPGHLSITSEIVYSRLDGARWHAVVAGGLAGLSVLWEAKSRRTTIAQQIFVRGLQGSWNSWSERFGISIPHGAILVFSLSCGQIMYAFLCRPETIPKSYNNWILRASKVWPETISINRQLIRTGTFDIPQVELLASRKGTTPKNLTVLNSALAAAKQGDFQGRLAGSCAMIHPWIDSCTYVEVERFVSVFTWMFPVYGALHVIPMILFKRNVFLKNPWGMLFRSLKGTIKSSTFLSVFVFIYQSIMCFKTQIHESAWAKKYLSTAVRNSLVSRASFWVLGFCTGLALFVEEERRRAELAMYVLPKGLESAWSMMRNRGYMPFIPFGDSILCAVGMSMVMSTYQHDPSHLSGLVRRVLYQFVGPN